MSTPGYDRVQAATDLLGQMLAGISIAAPDFAGRDAAELVADVALDGITADPDNYAVETTATVRSGDRYRIRVEWLPAESP
jgi:hypothetical protein